MAYSLRTLVFLININQKENHRTRKEQTGNHKGWHNKGKIKPERRLKRLFSVARRHKKAGRVEKLRKNRKFTYRRDHRYCEYARPDRHCLDLNAILEQVHYRNAKTNQRHPV